MKNNFQNPCVSVIMNCHNCEKYLKEAIDSVFDQTFKNWEIIFWDNNSFDSSAKIARDYKDKLRYFKSDKKLSLGKARDLALNEARGKYISFLDCDDIWMPKKLEIEIDSFEKDKNIGIVFSNAICFYSGTNKYFKIYGKNPPQGSVFRELLKNNFLCLSATAIRKETLLKLKEWFDPRFSYIEEADLFLRIAKISKLCYTGETLTKYRIHKENLTFKKKYSFANEMEILLEKFSILYPNFLEDYKEEIKEVKKEIARENFLLFWKEKKREKARTFLKPFLFEEKKFFLIYILSFVFPFSFCFFLYQFFNKTILFFRTKNEE